METSWRERLMGKLGLLLMGGAMLSKSLIQFSVDGQGCVPSLLFDLRPTMVEKMKIMTSFKRSCTCTAALSPWPCTRPLPTVPPPETPGHSQASLAQSLVGSLLPSPGSWCTQGIVCARQEFVSPVLCKFWWLYGGVNGDLLQEGLCHRLYDPGLLHTEPLWQSTADPYLHKRHSNTVLAQSLSSLWVLVHTRFCLCPPRVCFPSPVQCSLNVVSLKPLGKTGPTLTPRPCPHDGQHLGHVEPQVCQNASGFLTLCSQARATSPSLLDMGHRPHVLLGMSFIDNQRITSTSCLGHL